MSKDQLTIKSLDGLRGLAVMLVLLSHLSLHGMNLMPFLDFSGFGKAGVYLFFVLSAFLLSYQALLAGEHSMGDGWYWLGYLVRRICRIFPLYVVVLIVALILTTQTQGYGPRIPNAGSLVEHLTLQSGVSIYWAIPVEFAYYCVLPFVCLALLYTSKVSVWFASGLLLIGLSAVYFLWPPSKTAPNSIVLGPYLQMFLLGSFAGLIVSGRVNAEVLTKYSKVVGAIGWLALIVVALSIPAVWQGLFDPNAGNKVFHTYFLAYAVVWTTAVVAVLYGGLGFTRFFELLFWRFLGRISFSLYLWHLPIIQWVDRETTLNPMMQFVVTLLVAVAVSYLSYRVIERPFINWGHRVTSDWRALRR